MDIISDVLVIESYRLVIEISHRGLKRLNDMRFLTSFITDAYDFLVIVKRLC